jgi:hypothetical protein
MFRQKTKSNMKLVIRVAGLAVATALGISTAMAEPIHSSEKNALAGGIQLNDISSSGGSFTSVSTDVNATLYKGYNDSVSAPAFPARSIAAGGDAVTADQRAQCGFKRGDRFKIITPVPEPTTLIAGGLLLLPFAASALRLRSRSRLAVVKRSP